MSTSAPAPSTTTLNPLTRERHYILYFMHKSGRAIPETKIFPFKGSLDQAVVRGRDHCEIMNYKFLRVRPFIVDLEDQEEKKKMNPEYEDEYNMKY